MITIVLLKEVGVLRHFGWQSFNFVDYQKNVIYNLATRDLNVVFTGLTIYMRYIT